MEKPTRISPAKAVEVVFREGKWVVRVFADSEVEERDFALEAHANSFADGQRMRLGIYRP